MINLVRRESHSTKQQSYILITFPIFPNFFFFFFLTYNGSGPALLPATVQVCLEKKKKSTAHMQLDVSVVHAALKKVWKQLLCYNTAVLMPWQEGLITSTRTRYLFLLPGSWAPCGSSGEDVQHKKIQRHTNAQRKCIS